MLSPVFVDGLAPYVTDFNYTHDIQHDDLRWLQYPGPRPFYCIRSTHYLAEDGYATSFFENHNNQLQLSFYQVPKAPTFINGNGDNSNPLSTGRLYPPNFELWFTN